VSRKVLAALVLVILSLGSNLLFDPVFCVVPPCLTKSAAYRTIDIGSSSDEARRLLFRAGVSCAGGAQFKCSSVMFSDFWRDYAISFGPSGTVTEKRFSFRFHGRGILGWIHI
jgi:hypothetical protein